MATTLADLNTLINDRRRDSTANTIDMTTVGFRAINSTLDIWNSLHDWPWTVKDVNMNYNPNIDWYALDTIASDFKSPLTVKPYKRDLRSQEYWMVSELKFDSAQTKPRRFAVATKSGVQYLRLKSCDGLWSTLNTGTQYDQNGTWAGATAISNVTNDNYEGFDLPSSIAFDYSGTTGTLTNSTMQSTDVRAYKNRSNLYFDVYIPVVTALTSFSLKWGSSSGNYYSVTTTTDYLGATFKVGWNRVKFAWNSPTVVGTPDDSAINYLQVTVAYSVNPSTSNFRVQNFFISENIPVVLTYYSVNMVYDVSGSAQLQKFNDATATTDYPLWSGKWDVVTEAFVNSVLEIIFWITSETTDMEAAQLKIAEIVNPIKSRYPSQRRYPATFAVTDTNL